VIRSLEESSATTTTESTSATTKTSASAALATTAKAASTTTAATTTSATDALQEDLRSLDASDTDPVERFDEDSGFGIGHAQLCQSGDDVAPTLFVQFGGRLLSVFVSLLPIIEPQWFGFDDDSLNVHRQSFRELSQMSLPVWTKLIFARKPLGAFDDELVLRGRRLHRVIPARDVRAWWGGNGSTWNVLAAIAAFIGQTLSVPRRSMHTDKLTARSCREAGRRSRLARATTGIRALAAGEEARRQQAGSSH
jgi:hypothetical protein